MATNKNQDLHELSDSDLQTEIEGLELQYRRLKFDHAIKGLENPIQIRDLRKDIARLQTEKRKREIALMSPEQLVSRTKIRNRRRNR